MAEGLAEARDCIGKCCYPLLSQLCSSPPVCLAVTYAESKHGIVVSSLSGWLPLSCAITSLEASFQNLNDSLAVGKYSMQTIQVCTATKVFVFFFFKCFEA